MGETNKNSKQSKIAEFFDGVSAEFKKVIWPTPKDMAKQTLTVTAVSIVLGILIALVDIFAKYGVDFLTM